MTPSESAFVLGGVGVGLTLTYFFSIVCQRFSRLNDNIPTMSYLSNLGHTRDENPVLCDDFC